MHPIRIFSIIAVVSSFAMGCGEKGLYIEQDTITDDTSASEPSQEPAQEVSDETGVVTEEDLDGDGYTEADGDCDDSDPSISPDATDIANDGIDQDCDGVDATSVVDADRDGYDSSVDCNDNNPSVHPGANDIVGDGIDQDCDGVDSTGVTDVDGDGYDSSVDCNDYNPTIHPGAIDTPNDRIDQDCDGVDATGVTDADGDGYDSSVDCNDNNATIHPNATEIPNDGIDQDCNGRDLTQVSCASYEVLDCLGNCVDNSWIGDGVCNDGSVLYNNVAVYLDCSAHNYDNGDCSSSPIDNDGDGEDSSTDCDDNDPTIYTGAPEIINDGIDQDCDGVDSTSSGGCATNEILDCNGNCAPSYWMGDTFCDDGSYSYGGNMIDLNCATNNYDDGDCASVVDNDGDGENANTDCDDNDPTIYTGAPEIIGDGIDQDCDGVDATSSCSATEILDCNNNCVPSVWVGDGYCDNGTYPYNGIYADLDCAANNYDNGDCSSSPIDNDGDGEDSSTDCNDNDASIYTGATEIANDGIDQDCDGSDLTVTCGVGEMADCYGSCAPTLWLGDNSCDDGTYTYLGNQIYFDCAFHNDDNGDCSSLPTDNDGDGEDSSTDCNDNDASIYTGATEIANDGIDQDCDGVDLSVTCGAGEMADCNGNCVSTTWLGDTYCDNNQYSYNGTLIDLTCYNDDNGDCAQDLDADGDIALTDCNDYDASIYTGATEIANDGIDQDCDGIDLTVTCNAGEMADCYGSCAPTLWLGDNSCDDGTYTYLGNQIYFDCAFHNNDNGDCSSLPTDNDGDGEDSSTDCNDNDASIYTGATEIANDGIDQDCDGVDLTVTCGAGEMADCNYNCVSTTWLGDTYCDNNRYSYYGTLIDLTCYNNDDGDCAQDLDTDGDIALTDCNDYDASIYTGATEIANDGIDQDCDGIDLTVTCNAGEMADCYGSCAPTLWLGDNSCDDGTYTYLGNQIYFDCAFHNNDNGDCP